MTVRVTWFLWVLLYSPTSRVLNWSVAERTHMVSFVPLSAEPAEAPADGDVVEFELHAASDNGTARASSTAIPRRRLGGVIMRGSFVGPRPHRSVSTSTLRPKRLETGFAKVGGTREGVNRRY